MALEKTSSIVDLLRRRATHQPDQQAYTFLIDGKVDNLQSVTYGKLDRQARSIGARLQALNLEGERALLLYHPGLEFVASFFGCLYAGVVAIPSPPPDPRLKQSIPRLQAIINDAQPAAVLATVDILEQLKGDQGQPLIDHQAQSVATESIDAHLAERWQEPSLKAEQLAYLQYTSGSTSTPKGVMISHGNLMHHSNCVHEAWGYSSDSISATWLPYFHDYGLVDGLVQPIFAGIPSYIMAPMSFVKHPLRWLQAISHFRVTHTQAPNFAYDYCVGKTKPAERALLDLSCLRSAGNGAEPVREDTMARFIEAFAPSGFPRRAFCPAYGLAEATLVVSSKPPGEIARALAVEAEALEEKRLIPASSQPNGRIRTLVSCGPPVSSMKVVIADPELLCQCSPDRVGEIWVLDPSVAQGYWNRPEESKETFQGYLADTGEGPFLRTGDLGFMHQGELYITGRIKDMIIIHGQNYYPQDIEQTVESSHPALRPNLGAAFSVEVNGKEQLVVAQEVERRYQQKWNTDDIIEAVRKNIWDYHGLRVYSVALLKSGSISKTSSGKIQRHACREQFIEGHLKTVGTWQLPLVDVPQANGNNVENFAQPEVSKARADELIGWLRDYTNRRINSRIIDERRCLPPHIVLDLGNRGVLGLQVPEVYGGLGLNNSDTLRVFQQLGGIDLTLATFVIVNDVLGTRPIVQYGTPAARQELLPLIAGGRELAAFAYTEPGAGSNPRGIAATAVPDGNGGWLLNGEKIWIGLAAWAGVINVFAQQLDENRRPIGITGFVVRQGVKGLSHGPEALTTGMRGMIQNSVHFDNVAVGPEDLLGQPGAGMEAAALDAMMFTRLVMAAVSVGGMKRALQLMHRYAERRSIATGRLLDNPVSLARLSELTAVTTAVEALVTTVGWLLDAGYDVPEEAFVACKTSGPEYLWQAVNTLVQMLGGRGYIETNIAPQLMRDARIFRIFEGPTETLNMYMGSRVLNKNENIDRLLRDYLQATDVAEQLRQTAEQIQTRCLAANGTFADRSSATRWSHTLIGELATTALLLAATRSMAGRTGTAHLARAEAWAQHRFEEQIKQALSEPVAGPSLLGAAEITDLIAGYEETIGDLEQTLPGEDHSLASMLRRTPHDPDFKIVSEAAAPIRPEPVSLTVPSNGDKQPVADLPPLKTTIIDWLVSWLSRQLRLPAETVRPENAFADFGLDSVTAVELAMELGEWLAYPLEATIVWNFPTPEALADYLAGEMVAAQNKTTEESQVTKKQAVQIQQESDNLDRLSEAELADLLAEELTLASREK